MKTRNSKLPPIVGVDPNSHELACVWGVPGSSVEFETLKLVKGNAIAGTGPAFNQFGYLLHDIKEEFGEPPIVFMEEPVVVANRVGATLPQAYIQGAVMAACAEWMSPFRHVNNMTWKARILGDGGVKKGDIPRLMSEIWPEFVAMEGVTGDLIDAGAIYLYGVGWVRMTTKLRRQGVGASDGNQGQKEKIAS